jgi:hypothetical protein
MVLFIYRLSTAHYPYTVVHPLPPRERLAYSPVDAGISLE